MSKVHKENGGYIGKNFRLVYPSGIYVLGGVGRITDVTVDVELYGGKGGAFTSSNSTSTGLGLGGNGGYTKFRLIAPSTKTLQIRPAYVSGGSGTPWNSAGGAAAGLLIADQWLGVVGGGGGGGGRYEYYVPNETFSFYGLNNGGIGSGGYGAGLPSAGANASSCGVYFSGDPIQWTGASSSGGGGGGAGGGANGGSGCYGSYNNPGPTGGGGGGGGNLRIYKDQSVTSGYLSVLPDVYMQYTTHSNGTHASSPQVKITNVSSGQSYTYTSSADVPLINIADNIFT
jgi:hypothetical protein